MDQKILVQIEFPQKLLKIADSINFNEPSKSVVLVAKRNENGIFRIKIVWIWSEIVTLGQKLILKFAYSLFFQKKIYITNLSKILRKFPFSLFSIGDFSRNVCFGMRFLFMKMVQS